MNLDTDDAFLHAIVMNIDRREWNVDKVREAYNLLIGLPADDLKNLLRLMGHDIPAGGKHPLIEAIIVMAANQPLLDVEQMLSWLSSFCALVAA